MWEMRGPVIVAPVLELVVAEQCNLTCRACSHLSPVAPKNFANPVETGRALGVLYTAFHMKVVKLMGGEPLLHPDFAAVVAAVRSTAPSAELHLVTNGHLLSRMDLSELDGIDQITVSIYASAPIARSGRAALEQADRRGIRVVQQAMEQFNESYCEHPHSDPDMTRRIYRACKIAHDWNCFTLRAGFFYKCPQAYALTTVLGSAASGAHADNGVDLTDPAFADPAVLADRLHDYLSADQPLPACRHCLGSSGRAFRHEQLPRRLWRSAQSQAPSGLLT